MVYFNQAKSPVRIKVKGFASTKSTYYENFDDNPNFEEDHVFNEEYRKKSKREIKLCFPKKTCYCCD